jgi:hypothetical protein
MTTDMFHLSQTLPVLATFGFLKGENIIVYERDIDEDVNMLFHLK